jgi:hypothetical protein
LRHLVLTTVSPELRPDDNTGLLALGALAARGVHDPDTVPFGTPWTRATGTDLVRGVLTSHSATRATMTPHP